MTTHAIERVEPQTAALSTANPVAPLLERAMQSGVSPEVMQGYFQLYKDMEAEQAKKSFTKAFVALQSELPTVVAMKPVVSKGVTMYTYAPYEDVMEQVKPYLKKHGFCVSFTTRAEDVRVIVVCTLSHTDGHSQSNEYAVRIGSGPPNSSQTQGDGAAYTYAKRGALCNCLNIVVEKDTDGRTEGGFISESLARSLESRVKALKRNEQAFLKWANADSYAHIRTGQYAGIDAELKKMERAAVSPSRPAPVGSTAQASPEPPIDVTPDAADLAGESIDPRPAKERAKEWVAAQSEPDLRAWVNSQDIVNTCLAVKTAKVEGVRAAHPFKCVQKVAYVLKLAELEIGAK